MRLIDSILKHLFSRFLARRRASGLFRRAVMPDPARQPRGSSAVFDAITRQMRRVASDDIAAALIRLKSDMEGLSAGEAQARQEKFGFNEIEHEKPLPWWRHLWQCYNNPFNLLLSLLALISLITEDIEAAVVIATMVVLSTLIRFIQEARSNRAAEALKAMVSNTATVIRRGALPAKQMEIPIRELVPGDLIALSAGDMIPADCRLLAAKDLFVSQAAMTGESLPVEKFPDISQPFDAIFDTPNLLFMGTNVISGSATALVVATGNRSYFGALSVRVASTGRVETAFQSGVNSVSWLLIRFALVMVPVVLAINGFTKGDWMEVFLFALSVAVGLTPEMLPMIVTSTLAKGAVQLSR